MQGKTVLGSHFKILSVLIQGSRQIYTKLESEPWVFELLRSENRLLRPGLMFEPRHPGTNKEERDDFWMLCKPKLEPGGLQSS
jgi:hypothetical protein